MGKHKTKIERIENPKNRHLAFYKRKKGLLKKAMELSIMCDVHLILCIFNTNSKKCAEFTTMPLQNLIDMYNKIPRKDVAVFSPSINFDDNGDYVKISPLEWSNSTKDQLTRSANKIRESKEAALKNSDEESKRDSKAKRKHDAHFIDDFIDDDSIFKKSVVSCSDNAVSKTAKPTQNKKRKCDSDMSDSDNSEDDVDMDSMSDSEDRTQNVDHMPNTTIKQLDEISRMSHIVFSQSPQNIISDQSGINLNTSKNNTKNKGSEIIEFSPVFKTSLNSDAKQNKIEEQKHQTLSIDDVISKALESPAVEGLQLKDSMLRKDSSNALNMFNQPSKIDENLSFTFENQNQGTCSIKSLVSPINLMTSRCDNISVPLKDNSDQLKNDPSDEVYVTYKQFIKDGATLNNSDMPSPAPLRNTNQAVAKPSKDDQLMMMLDEISDIDESLATTKQVLKGSPIALEHGDEDKKNKRKEKLKLKTKGLKLNIPSQNKFLPETQIDKTEKLSPVRKIYTPTPTKMLITPQGIDSGCEPQMFWNQLSNKWANKFNCESPYMFFQESRGNGYSNFEPKFGTPNKLMSPGSQMSNLDFLKNYTMLSGNFLLNDNRDSAFMNASPCLLPKTPVIKLDMSQTSKSFANSNLDAARKDFGSGDAHKDEAA